MPDSCAASGSRASGRSPHLGCAAEGWAAGSGPIFVSVVAAGVTSAEPSALVMGQLCWCAPGLQHPLAARVSRHKRGVPLGGHVTWRRACHRAAGRGVSNPPSLPQPMLSSHRCHPPAPAATAPWHHWLGSGMRLPNADPKMRMGPGSGTARDGILAWEPAGPGGCRVGLPGSRCCRGALIAAGSRRARGFVPRSRGRRVAPLMGKLMSRGARGRWWQPGPRLCRQPLPARGGSKPPLPFGHPSPSPASVSPTSLVWGGTPGPRRLGPAGFSLTRPHSF